MEGYEFHNVEVLDGYFSGVIIICIIIISTYLMLTMILNLKNYI